VDTNPLYPRALGGGDRTFTKIRAWDKVQALEKLAKHLGLYAKDGGKGANIQFNFGRLEKGVL
jgi:hypothetical protein